MSHFTVLVCLPPSTDPERIESALGDVLAPWDEGLSVEPYREYKEEGSTDSAGNGLLYDAELNRAYRMTTYNPESKWDWWSIGGRWQRRLIALPGVDASALVFGEPGAFGDNGVSKCAATGGLHCDGGPRYLLDFEAMRAVAEEEASREYDLWESVSAGTPPMRPWADLCGLVELGELTVQQARHQYREQQRVQRAEKVGLIDPFGGPVEERFLADRDEYVLSARRAAVPGYALVSLDREWIAPGRMGWFGMSSDGPGERDGYHIAVNTYLDGLGPNAFVVLVDCHI